ncbi:hypothetical protein RYH80_18695 [Halobaculum sp. MBLA0147]|uniref:hypothetical protein n=1 Tax=Halobaculum sp. MBLA0147 TaxID=3079934 RepID=UPI003523F619
MVKNSPQALITTHTLSQADAATFIENLRDRDATMGVIVCAPDLEPAAVDEIRARPNTTVIQETPLQPSTQNRVVAALTGVLKDAQVIESSIHTEAVLDQLSRSLAILDSDNSFKAVRETFADLYNLQPAEIRGSHWSDIFNWEFGVETPTPSELLDGDPEWQGPLFGPRGDGTFFLHDAHLIRLPTLGIVLSTQPDPRRVFEQAWERTTPPGREEATEAQPPRNQLPNGIYGAPTSRAYLPAVVHTEDPDVSRIYLPEVPEDRPHPAVNARDSASGTFDSGIRSVDESTHPSPTEPQADDDGPPTANEVDRTKYRPHRDLMLTPAPLRDFLSPENNDIDATVRRFKDWLEGADSVVSHEDETFNIRPVTSARQEVITANPVVINRSLDGVAGTYLAFQPAAPDTTIESVPVSPE